MTTKIKFKLPNKYFSGKYIQQYIQNGAKYEKYIL